MKQPSAIITHIHCCKKKKEVLIVNTVLMNVRCENRQENARKKNSNYLKIWRGKLILFESKGHNSKTVS